MRPPNARMPQTQPLVDRRVHEVYVEYAAEHEERTKRDNGERDAPPAEFLVDGVLGPVEHLLDGVVAADAHGEDAKGDRPGVGRARPEHGGQVRRRQ